MNRFAFALLSAALAAVSLAATIGAGESVFTPKPGNPERKAILDAVRPAVQEITGQPRIVFVVERLLVCESWAWLWGRPQAPDVSQRYEDVTALVRHGGQGWRLVRMLGIEAGEVDDPDLAEQRQWLGLKKEFPDLPQALIDAALAGGQ